MANNIINLILTSAGYLFGLFDHMLTATGLFGWFTFCFFTFTVYRLLLVPLLGRSISVGFSDEVTSHRKASTTSTALVVSNNSNDITRL